MSDPDSFQGEKSPRRSLGLAGVVLAALLVTQLLVPAFLLLGPRPARFGWQMYSTAADLPRMMAVDATGAERAVAVEPLLAGPRAEIDFVPLLLAQGCRLIDAERIRVQAPGGPWLEAACP